MADELIFRLTVDDAGSAILGAFERKLRGLESEAKTLSGSMKTAFGNVSGYIVNFAGDAAREFAKFSKESVDAFLKFETAMVAVAKTTGIPKEQLGKFSEQIRETAVNLKGLGKDAAVQIASIAEVAGQLGISADKLAKGDFEAASQEILGFSTTIAKAKIALPEFTGGVEQIATVVAKQIQLFGETPAAAEQYLSVMNKLSDTTAATAVEISSFLSKFTIAPTLKIAQEEAAAWGATFVSLGQNAYDAATRMQSSFSQVLAGSKDTNTAINGLFEGNKRMAEQLEQLAGRSVEQAKSYSNLAREAIGKDANEAMKIFVTTLSEVESSSERAAIATDMFGRVGAKAILTLIPELPKLSDAAKEAATVFLSTNEQALDSLAKMSGVSRKEFSDNADFMAAVYKKDMPDAIRVLVTEINKIDDEQEKARVASQVFGDDWQVAMNKAQGGVKLFDEALLTAQKEIEATKNGASSIEKEYSTALDKVGTSFSELTAIMDDIKLQWGAPLAEALSAGISLMIPVIEELRKNFMGVVEEFGRELGGETLASGFRQTAEAFKGVIEEMGANADTFIAALKEQFTLPNLLATAADQWNAFALLVGEGVAKLASEAATGLKGLAADMAAAIGDAMEGMILAGIEKVKAGIEQIKTFIKDGLTGGFSDAGYKKEMEDIFSAQEIGLQNVTAAMGEKTAATQEDLDALIQLKNANIELLQSNTDLRAEYQGVARDLSAAIESGQAPTAELTARMESLRQKIQDVGVEAYGNSTFPDMTAAMMTSQAQSQALTAEMAAMQAQIKGLGAEYEATDKQIQEKQDSIRDLNTQIREQQTLLRTASEAEKEGIQNTITQIRNKKDAIQSEISDLQELSRDQKEARKAEETALKESIQQLKEKQKAVDELAKNTQRTADLRAKQQQEEMKAANDLYREQQKQAADSIKWVSDLDDATKKRILGEQDAVKVLQEQGVTLTDLQAQEVRRMQQAYQTEQAYEAQVKALEAQLDPMGALVAAGDKLSSSLGGLSQGIGSIGSLFNIDTSGIENVISKIQQIAQLPQTIGGIVESVKGIGSAVTGVLGSLGGIGSAVTGALGGIGSAVTGALGSIGGALGSIGGAVTGALGSIGGAVSGVLGGLGGLGGALGGIAAAAGPVALAGGAIFAAWKGISALFADTKSKGTEAAETFQDFVRDSITGGEELARGMDRAFHGMDFHDQFAQMTDYTYQLWNAFANTPIDGVNTGLQLLEQTMKAAGVPTEKLGQVAIQTFVGMQYAGYSAAEMSAKFAEMLNLTTEQADLLVQTLTGIAPPDVTVDVTAKVDLETFNKEFEGLSSIVDDWSTRFKESGLEFWTPDEYTNEFNAITAKLEDLGAKGILSAEQIGAVNDVLKEITADGKVTAEELQQLEQAMRDVQDAAQADIQPIEVPVIVKIDPAAIEETIASTQSLLTSASEFFTLNPTVEFQSFDDSGLAGMTAQLEALRNAGGLTQAQFTTLNDLLIKIGADGQVTATEVQELNAAFTAAQATSAATTAALQDMSLTSDMATQAFNSLTAMLTTLQTNGSITDAQLQALGSSLQTIMADGQMTGLEMQNFAASLTAAGVPADQVSAQILKIAEASGMTTAQIEQLQASLTGVSTQMAGTGEEGAATTNIFSSAQEAAGSLTSTTTSLSGNLSSLTGQLAGTGAETLATSNLFTLAGGSAMGLQDDVNNLDSQVVTANASLQATQAALAAIPNEKAVTFRIQTVGEVPRMATGGTIGASGLAIVNERGSEIAHFPGGGMALMTAPGPTLGAFPTGTEIIPHSRAMDILSQFPGIPRMATGGTVGAMGGTVINVSITGNTISKDTDLRVLAREVSAEISRSYRARA